MFAFERAAGEHRGSTEGVYRLEPMSSGPLEDGGAQCMEPKLAFFATATMPTIYSPSMQHSTAWMFLFSMH